MFDITIIGCGVAGMTAALYSLRANKKVLILEKESYGGQIAKSPLIENFPTKKSASGSELADELFEQIMELGVEFELENVEKIVPKDGGFTITTDYNSYETKTVIIANGVKPRTLGLDNEDKFLGNGVYYCAVCDGPFFAGQDVVLVGDGNSAMQYALMLSGYCNKVTMVTMFDKFFGEKVLEQKLRETKNIEIIPNAVASKLIGEEKLSSVQFKSTDGSIFEISTNALFVAIGQLPDNEKFSNIVELDRNGYIVATEETTTKTKGVFVAGDTRTKSVRQVTTAVADGATASVCAVNYINLGL